MAYEVVRTNEFSNQLAQAVSYRVESYGTRSARRLLSDYEKMVHRLSAMPLSGTSVESTSASESDALRWLRMGSYLVIDRPDTSRETVVLEKLFVAGSNWRKRVLS